MSNHHKIPAMFHGQKIGRKGLRFFWAGQSCEPIGFPRCAFLVLLVICMTKKKSDLTRNNGGLTNWNGSFSNGNGGWTWFNQPNGSITGWWFGTFFIFYNIWDNPSHWLIFFGGVETCWNHQPAWLDCFFWWTEVLMVNGGSSERNSGKSIFPIIYILYI